MSADRRSSRFSGPLMVATLLLVTLAATTVGYLWNLDRLVNDHLTRVQGAFPPEADRPVAAQPDEQGRRPLTVLFLGSQRLPDAADTPGTSADTVMVVRVSAARDRVDVVSVPADAMVPVPGYGTDRISAAMTRGGLPLSVRTVEQLIGVRVDHVAVLDLHGVKDLTDAVGGVDVDIERPFTVGRHQFSAGLNHLDGDAALALVREQATLPGRDLDRARNQHEFLRGLVAKVISGGTMSDPALLQDLLGTAADNLAIDEQLSPSQLRSLALSLRRLDPADVHFATLPISSATGLDSGPLVVHLDPAGLSRLRHALARGDMATFRP